MANTKTVTHYAHSAHGQVNNNLPEAKLRATWTNINKASASDVTKAPAGSSSSVFGHLATSVDKKTGMAKSYGNIRPWTFTGVDFGFDIPDCAYVTNIRFEVPINKDGNATIKSPYVKFNIYHGTKSVKTDIKDHDGWYNGYLYQKSNHKYLSKAWKTHVYEMSGDEFRKRGYSISELKRDIFGIDLYWQDATDTKLNFEYAVHIKYIKCIITYELPDEQITFDRVTTGDTPRVVNCGEWYDVDITYRNKSNSRCCDDNGNPISRQLEIKFPPNAQITWASFDNTPYDPQTNTWTVPCKANDWENINFGVRDWGSGLDKITVKGAGKTWNYWVYSSPQSVDVGYVTGYTGTMQKDVLSCVTFVAKVNASDGTADFDVNLVAGSADVYPVGEEPVLPPATNVIWTLDEQKSSRGVSLDTDREHTDDNNVRFIVPRGEAVDIVFTGCFIPKFTGWAFAECSLQDKPEYGCSVEYNVIEPPIYIVRNTPKLDKYDRTTEEITLSPSVLRFKTHRVATSTEIAAYIIDCSVADFDGTMIDDECTLSANVWEKIDYIGCVPLHYHHYDPQSTYTNKGINESYKNKTYMGKEGVIDEKITLKFKAKPKEVPVLQGLVKLDKPTPINANWRCFEGDPLNHRGWVVFSEIKCERTNPLWYDCEGEVDYLTHDIYTKFQIFKELQVNSKSMPTIMAETFELGSNLSGALDIFNIDTDGGFVYDSEGEDGAKNLFSLDEGQHLMIATRNPLKNVSQLRFDWYSTKINENRENTMERVFRLKDNKGSSVFEYEYTNIQYFEDYVTCDIVARIRTDGEGWKVQTYYDVDLKTEIEADPIVAVDVEDAEEDIVVVSGDSDEYYYYDTDLDSYELITDDDYDGNWYTYDSDNDTYVLVDRDSLEEEAYNDSYIAPSFDTTKYDVTTVYGSSIEFTINGNKLTVYEAGYNGREIGIENIELVKSNAYYFETYWENHNVDGMTEDVMTYIDIDLAETVLSTEYAQYYTNLMVSPFPIPYKTVVFTRESEEGTIYYLTGDEPFKYRIEPYYQYHCGCDMVTRDGVSIFDLNNSHTYFYIENGLVRLGFNKFNGRLYLAKWDITSKDWLTTHYFHMSADTKFSLQSYSDDKIVIKAGNDTYFTIWRGHPFIGIKNPKDKIFFDGNFNYCLSDKVNGVTYPYPVVFSFMNSNNLLPECLGGTKLDYDCIAIDDDDITSVTSHTLTLTPPQTAPTAGVNCTLDVTLTPSTADGSVHYLVNNIDVATVESPFDLTYAFPKKGDYTVQAVYVGDEDDDIAISNKIVVKVNAPAVRPSSPVAQEDQDSIPGNYSLKIIEAPKQFTYKDGKSVVLQLKKGNVPIHGYVIECQALNGQTYTTETDKNGKVTIKNKGYDVGRYQWGGRFYDATDVDHNRKLIEYALRWIDIVKAKPSFKYNASSGVLNKGKNLVVKLMGVNAPRTGQTLTYTINGGSKKSKKTNAKGNIHIPMNTKGTFKVKVMYAGTKNYEAISKTFTVKVV